jgi:hypothetical protein
LKFIGGESQRFRFRLVSPLGSEFNANGCYVSFSVINHSNKNGDPLIVKTATLDYGLEGVLNIAIVELLPEDTVNMYGRYIYQLSIRDSYEEIELPGKGELDISRNIHRGFITN